MLSYLHYCSKIIITVLRLPSYDQGQGHRHKLGHFSHSIFQIEFNLADYIIFR